MVTLRLIDERDPFRPTASRELTHGEMSVGRDPGADWRIDDPDRKLSRIHCVFSVDREGAVSVRDTSSNGVSAALSNGGYGQQSITVTFVNWNWFGDQQVSLTLPCHADPILQNLPGH